jgi:tRNA threonylcarbamoyladenosine biosynthesis protein TsaB
MLTLAIETSGRIGSIALQRDDAPPVERTLAELGHRHAQTLVMEIERLLHDCAVNIRDCQLVAVSMGPGSFTGLRVGAVCAKTLAYATGALVVAVDTFECVAGNSPPDVHAVQIVGDAQRGGLFVGRYGRQSSGEWRREGDISIVNTADWVQDLVLSDVVSGWGMAKVPSPLQDRCRVLDPLCWTSTAATIAKIGRRLAERNQFADCMTLEPFYLRTSAAEEKAGGFRVSSPEVRSPST